MFVRSIVFILSLTFLLMGTSACSTNAPVETLALGDPTETIASGIPSETFTPDDPTETITPEDQASRPNQTPVDASLEPEELIRISGDGPFVSEPFTLDGKGTVELFWVQDCDVFYLQMVNANETLAQSPYGTIIFESAASPTENTEIDDFQIPFEYVPGEYVIQVDAEGGSWEVWARVEPSEGE